MPILDLHAKLEPKHSTLEGKIHLRKVLATRADDCWALGNVIGKVNPTCRVAQGDLKQRQSGTGAR